MAKGYWIVDVTVHNQDQYVKYIAADSPVVEKWGGSFIVRGGTHEVLEGNSHERQVVIEFESYAQALACYHSEEYQRARQHRLGAADINIVIVEGV